MGRTVPDTVLESRKRVVSREKADPQNSHTRIRLVATRFFRLIEVYLPGAGGGGGGDAWPLSPGTVLVCTFTGRGAR